jgi:uncharacterized protein YeaO (DUF488 family)
MLMPSSYTIKPHTLLDFRRVINMLQQATISQYKQAELSRANSHLVVTMRHYPRFLRRELRDEFLCDLSPETQLLAEFNAAQKRLADHNSAFAEVEYEKRFQLSARALEHLKRLAQMSANKDVYLACICRMGERCHREMLLLAATELFGCRIGPTFHSYPDFMARVDALSNALPLSGTQLELRAKHPA